MGLSIYFGTWFYNLRLGFGDLGSWIQRELLEHVYTNGVISLWPCSTPCSIIRGIQCSREINLWPFNAPALTSDVSWWAMLAYIASFDNTTISMNNLSSSKNCIVGSISQDQFTEDTCHSSFQTTCSVLCFICGITSHCMNKSTSNDPR